MNQPRDPFMAPAAEAGATDRSGPAADADAGLGTGRSARIGVSHPHESAHLHVAGAAPYIDDLPEITGTLHAALGLSPVAHGTLLAIDLAILRAQPGVVAVLTAADRKSTV